MIVPYLTLSHRKRETAQALAKKLLHTIPAAEKGEVPKALREAMNMPFVRPRNLIAVRIYDDGADNWRGEVVMDNEGHFYQVGQDWGSCGEALGWVKVLLAQVKAKDSWLEVTDLKRAA